MVASKKGRANVFGSMVDPVGYTNMEVKERMENQNASFLHQTPLREWLLGLAWIKARVGSQLSWNEIVVRLTLAAEAATKPGAKITVDGKQRRPTKDEMKVLLMYGEHPKTDTSIKNYLRHRHPQLWMQIKAAANGRGTGVRRDEEAPQEQE